MATREATPPPVIGKAGRYTVFITPPATPRPSEGSRSQSRSPSPSPSASPKYSARNVAPLPSDASRSLSSSRREKLRSNLSPKDGDFLPVKGVEKSAAVAMPPPVQVPPPQFEKGKGGKSSGSVFGFFWDAVAKVQDAHLSLDQYLADWLGLDQSRYQWALNDYYESSGARQHFATLMQMNLASNFLVSHFPLYAFNSFGKDGGKPKELVSKGHAV